MVDKRQKDQNWTIERNLDGKWSFDAAHLAVLMDIRDELKAMRRRPDCAETLAIPRMLKQIRANTTKRRRKIKK